MFTQKQIDVLSAFTVGEVQNPITRASIAEAMDNRAKYEVVACARCSVHFRSDETYEGLCLDCLGELEAKQEITKE